jgi:hypothetical protein
MSWFKNFYNISLKNADDLYSVVPLPEYYEWLYTGSIPSGTVFTRHVPKSETPTENMLIVSARIPQRSLKKVELGFRLAEDAKTDTSIVAGELKTPSEVVDSFSELIDKFDRDLNRFKESCSVRRYIMAESKEPHLYRIKECQNDGIVLENLGTSEELDVKMGELKKEFDEKAATKEGRAFETEDSRRFENAITKLKASDLPLDDADIDFIVSKSGIIPTNTRLLAWRDCFLEMSKEATELEDKIRAFSSLEWVRNLAHFW